MSSNFEWDEVKADRNYYKHGISFVEAQDVFSDFTAYIFDDDRHSKIEKRELIIGYSNTGKLLIVCFTMRQGKIRIINARSTNKIEREEYEKNRQNKYKS